MGVPWQFVSDSGTEDFYADIYYGGDIEFNARLIIVPCRFSVHWSRLQMIEQDGLVFLDFEGKSPYNFLKSEGIGSKIIISCDLIFTVFSLLTGKLEQGLKKNRWDIHNIQDFALYKWNLMHLPIVDSYALFMKSIFQSSIQFLPKWPENKRFAVILSHDVDYPEMIRWIEAIRYSFQKRKISLAKIRDILHGEESFWRFTNWTELETANRLKSSFYFTAIKGNLLRYLFIAPDPFYNVGKYNFLTIAEHLKNEGFEIGLHSSFKAFQSEDKFRMEKSHLEHTFRIKITGNRHHYWHINHDRPFDTSLIHQNLGFIYDSSVVMEKHSGFRYGICSPFTFFHPDLQSELSVIQLAPSLMDDHLFGHSKHCSFPSYKEHIDSLLGAVHKYEGMLVVDYHVRVFNETLFPGWANSYRYLISRLSEYGGFYNTTASELADYWKTRSKLIESQSIS
jgi:hypothetical protein